MNAVHPHDDLAALALDALDAPRRAEVLAHVECCPECAALERDFRETAGGLAELLPPAEPDPGLRGRLLALARADGATEPTPRPEPSEPASRLAATEQQPRLAFSTPRARSGRWLAGRWPGLVAAAIALIALGWATTLQLRVNALTAENAQLQTQADRYERVVSVLAAPSFESRRLSSDGQGGAWGRLYYQADGSHGMLMVEHLPPPPPGMVYQVWLVRQDGARASAGQFNTNANGWAYTLLQCDQPFGSFQRVGITAEPAQGSPGPTGTRVLGASL